MNAFGGRVGITPYTKTVTNTFYRAACVKESPITEPPWGFINIRIGGGDEPMREALRGCLL